MKEKRVLVIEDEPNISTALSFILSRNGWQVDVSADGQSAIGTMRDDPPDLLILDLMLPGISGFDVLRSVREAEGTRDLPVLMLTAKGQIADRAEAERLGVNRFMTKPFSNADVIAAVQELAGP